MVPSPTELSTWRLLKLSTALWEALLPAEAVEFVVVLSTSPDPSLFCACGFRVPPRSWKTGKKREESPSIQGNTDLYVVNGELAVWAVWAWTEEASPPNPVPCSLSLSLCSLSNSILLHVILSISCIGVLIQLPVPGWFAPAAFGLLFGCVGLGGMLELLFSTLLSGRKFVVPWVPEGGSGCIPTWLCKVPNRRWFNPAIPRILWNTVLAWFTWTVEVRMVEDVMWTPCCCNIVRRCRKYWRAGTWTQKRNKYIIQRDASWQH